MEVDVTHGESEADAPTGESVAPRTPMFDLKTRAREIREGLHLSLQVPRWKQPDVFVKFKPVASEEFATAQGKRERDGGPSWVLLSYCDAIADSCEEVYFCHPDDTHLPHAERQKFSLADGDPYGPKTRFDSKLADALGLIIAPDDPNKIATIVRGLYLTDGDIISAAGDLLDWSSRASVKAEGDF